MKISALPVGYKTTTRFTRPAHVKNDTHYIYTTEKYVVEIVYHSSMFYAPDFYKVSVSDKSGQQIWSGGDTMFLDSLFRTDFVSDKYDRMILTRVNSTESSNHMQVILIDLKTGKEEVLAEEGHYHIAGHFMSFDGIYYGISNDLKSIDVEMGKEFLLFETLAHTFSEIKSWSTCPIDDCILVITNAKENNVALFDLRKEEIKGQATLQWKEADQVSLQNGFVLNDKATVVSISYSTRTSSGALMHTGTEHFQIDF